LALALSDLASKNIRLESLFIDEGFGTLDPETLDLALNTLEKLQQEAQKNIGIISHVESIKERITTQIRLERNNRGFSHIVIH
jgi:exonuclease SbcC